LALWALSLVVLANLAVAAYALFCLIRSPTAFLLARFVTDDPLIVPLLLAAFASIDFCNPLKNISPGPPKADIAERDQDVR
jgi:hypothetical protein